MGCNETYSEGAVLFLYKLRLVAKVVDLGLDIAYGKLTSQLSSDFRAQNMKGETLC